MDQRRRGQGRRGHSPIDSPAELCTARAFAGAAREPDRPSRGWVFVRWSAITLIVSCWTGYSRGHVSVGLPHFCRYLHLLISWGNPARDIHMRDIHMRHSCPTLVRWERSPLLARHLGPWSALLLGPDEQRQNRCTSASVPYPERGRRHGRAHKTQREPYKPVIGR